METRPDNVLLYATSNRRHLIRETWSDRSDMEHDGDIHRSDTMEEKLSLASRFGVAINYSSPNREQYYDIVRGLAARAGRLDLPEGAAAAARKPLGDPPRRRIRPHGAAVHQLPCRKGNTQC